MSATDRSTDLPTDIPALQRRVVRTLAATQVLGGIGMASGIAVGVLLGFELSGSETQAGFATTAQVLGAALIAVPVARVMAARGRRAGLLLGLALAFLGAGLVVGAAVAGSFPLMLAGMLLFGGGTSANGQARFAAADLATEAHKGRDLSLVVWATTIGSVLGPNLIDPGAALARRLGIPELSGSFVFSLGGFALAALVVARWLRPDPLLVSRALTRRTTLDAVDGHAAVPTRDHAAVPTRDDAAVPSRDAGAVPTRAEADRYHSSRRDPDHDGSVGRGMRILRANPRARQAVLTVALGHAVMVGVMVMTPIHMRHGEAGISLIGLTISLHILGMYAFSPLVGTAVDRVGGPVVALVGTGILAAACLLAATSHDGASVQLVAGLLLLGVGWSCTFVSGSAMLVRAVGPSERPASQGVSELMTGLVGACAGAVAGTVVEHLGFGWLAVGALVPVAVVAAVNGRRR